MRIAGMFKGEWKIVLCLVAAVMLVSGCGARKTVVMKQSELDIPEHHNISGTNLLDKGDLDGALIEFERAKNLDQTYAPAFVGSGVCLGKKSNFDEAFRQMDLAEGYAKTDAHKVLYHTGMIRLYTDVGKDDWLKEAQAHFKTAKNIDGMDPAPHFYMGLACKKSGDYADAADLFKNVITLNKGYRDQADSEWERIQNIVRAQPGTNAGKAIAKLDRISRADVAALLIEEMNIEKIFNSHTVFLNKPASLDEEVAPNDYQNHVLKADIDRINALDIKGLEVIGHRFDPDGLITRADFAVMIEDIIVRVTGDRKLPVSNIDSASPFKDVYDSHFAKNAIMTCTTRGVMKADINGYFRGNDPVSGAEALLIIRRLNDQLQ